MALNAIAALSLAKAGIGDETLADSPVRAPAASPARSSNTKLMPPAPLVARKHAAMPGPAI